MFEFEVNDMTCGHCVGAITKALNADAPGVVPEFDVENHRLSVSGANNAEAIAAIIRDAGYTPVRLK